VESAERRGRGGACGNDDSSGEGGGESGYVLRFAVFAAVLAHEDVRDLSSGRLPG
jgi:hypothetical protein